MIARDEKILAALVAHFVSINSINRNLEDSAGVGGK
jgi:hypothetical protein